MKFGAELFVDSYKLILIILIFQGLKAYFLPTFGRNLFCMGFHPQCVVERVGGG